MIEGERTVRVTRLRDQGKEPDLRKATPAECLGMMWQLALDAWAMMGEPVTDKRMRRDLVRVVRGREWEPAE